MVIACFLDANLVGEDICSIEILSHFFPIDAGMNMA